MRAPGTSPRPAVILLHRVFGIEDPHCYAREFEFFRGIGVSALLVDSNSAPVAARNGWEQVTQTGYDILDQAADLEGAVRFLISRAEIDVGRIAVVGYAYGGSAVLRAISKDVMRSRFSRTLQSVLNTISAFVAFHPSCPTELSDVSRPLLIINEQNDRINSTPVCRDMIGRTKSRLIEQFIVQGAGHNFDMDWFTEYDPVATELA